MNTNNLTNVEKLDLMMKLHNELCETIVIKGRGLKTALTIFDSSWRMKLEQLDEEVYDQKMKNWKDAVVKYRCINNPIGEVQEWEMPAQEGLEFFKEEIVEDNIKCYWKVGEKVDMKVEVIVENIDSDFDEMRDQIRDHFEKEANSYIKKLIPNGIKEVK